MSFDTAAARSRAPAGGAPADGLHAFLQSIRSYQPLPHPQLVELARARVAEEQALRRALYLVPEVADALLDDWLQRRRDGRVTGVMAEDDGTSFERRSRRVDRSLESVDRLRERARGVSRREDTGLRVQTADQLVTAGFSLELLFRIRRELGPVRGHRARTELSRADRAIARWTDARDRIVRHNVRLVVRIVGQRARHDVPLLDLIQEGVLGLVRAAEKFDPERGFRFSTYAVWWIEQALIRAVQKQSRVVRLPAHVYEQQLRLRRAVAELEAHGGDAASAESLAERLGTSLEQVDQIQGSFAPLRSLDAPLGPDAADELVERLGDSSLPDPADGIQRGEIREVLERSFASLSARETLVLTRRFGLDGSAPQTLEQVGTELGISRERVRQIERGILDRLAEDASVRSLAEAIR